MYLFSKAGNTVSGHLRSAPKRIPKVQDAPVTATVVPSIICPHPGWGSGDADPAVGPILGATAAEASGSNHMLDREKRQIYAGAHPAPGSRNGRCASAAKLHGDRLIESDGDQNAAKDPNEIFRKERLLQECGDAGAGIAELRRDGFLGVPAHHDDGQVGPAFP